MLYIIVSVWLGTGSNPADINRFRSHTGINTKIIMEVSTYLLIYINFLFMFPLAIVLHGLKPVCI